MGVTARTCLVDIRIRKEIRKMSVKYRIPDSHHTVANVSLSVHSLASCFGVHTLCWVWVWGWRRSPSRRTRKNSQGSFPVRGTGGGGTRDEGAELGWQGTNLMHWKIKHLGQTGNYMSH